VIDNLPAVVSSLLEAYAAFCPRLSREQHVGFINLLTYDLPATATLLALSSHLSLVAPVVPRRGMQRGEPGGPPGASTDGSSSIHASGVSGIGVAGLQQENASSLVQPTIKETVVQPISADFVAKILALRVQPGSIQLQQLLPESLRAQDVDFQLGTMVRYVHTFTWMFASGLTVPGASAQ
jgi:hypothetical protein